LEVYRVKKKKKKRIGSRGTQWKQGEGKRPIQKSRDSSEGKKGTERGGGDYEVTERRKTFLKYTTKETYGQILGGQTGKWRKGGSLEQSSLEDTPGQSRRGKKHRVEKLYFPQIQEKDLESFRDRRTLTKGELSDKKG